MSRSHRPTAVEEVSERLAAVTADHPSRTAEYARLLAALRETGGSCRLAVLARRLTDGGDAAAYRAAYLRLRREHVPTLVTLGAVEYDEEHGTVALLEE